MTDTIGDAIRKNHEAGNLTITLKDNTMNDMIINELKEKIAELEKDLSDAIDVGALWQDRWGELASSIEDLNNLVKRQ